MNKDKLCLACDIDYYDEIISMVEQMKDLVGYFKFNSAFTKFGPRLIQDVKDRGVKVFLDMKFHDIPYTVSKHVKACVKMEIDILTIHAAGGQMMMQEAVLAGQTAMYSPKIIAVTAMTSMTQEDVNAQMRIPGSINEYIVHCAISAAQSGVDGIVCSAADIAAIHDEIPEGMMYVTPGIRTKITDKDDQERIMTPKDALNAGSSLLVVGRSVYTDSNPRKVIEDIYQVTGD